VARITLATISKDPTLLIRKAHATGVGAGRDKMLGKIILKSWKDMLSVGGMELPQHQQ